MKISLNTLTTLCGQNSMLLEISSARTGVQIKSVWNLEMYKKYLKLEYENMK